MEHNAKIERRPLAAGVGLMIAGSLLAVAQLDLLEVSELVPLWPLIVVGVGVAMATAGGRDARRSGAWVALIGAWLLVNTLEVGGFNWWTSWPLVVILAGAFEVAWPNAGEARGSGLFTIAIGVWLLVATQGWFGLGWRDSWPVLLVLVGSSMVGRALLQARAAAGSRK
jgi:hypothetical protein